MHHRDNSGYSQVRSRLGQLLLVAPSSSERGTSDSPTASIGEYNILVIDGNEGICRALQRFLGDSADNIFAATSAAAAFEILRRYSVAALVCDHNLGTESLDGISLTKLIRKRYPRIRRAVIFTGDPPSSLQDSPAVDAVCEKGEDDVRLRDLVKRG